MAKFLKSFGLPLVGGLAGSFLGGKVLSPMLSQQFGKTAGGYLGSALGGAAGGAITGALTGGKAGKSALIGGGTGLASQAISNFSKTGGLTSAPRQTSSFTAPSAPVGSGESVGGVLSRRRDIGSLMGVRDGKGLTSLGSKLQYSSDPGRAIPSNSSPIGISTYSNGAQGLGAGLGMGVGQGAGQALAQNAISAFQNYPPSGGGSMMPNMAGGGGGQPPPQFPPPGGGQSPPPGVRPGFVEGARQSDIFGINAGDAKKAGIQGAFGLASDLISPDPEVPNLGQIPSIESLRSSAGLPQTELGQLAQTRLSEQLNAPFGLEAGVEQNISRVFDERRKSLISQFKTIRPNADLTSDTAFRQAMYNLDQQEAETMSMARQRAYDTFQTQRRQDIATALGIDEQKLNTLTQLAQLDVDQIMLQLQLDYNSAKEFKEAWMGIAQILTGSGKVSNAEVEGAMQ